MRKKILFLVLPALLLQAFWLRAQDRPPIIIKPKLADDVHVAAAEFQPKNRQQLGPELSAALTAFNSALWEDLKFAGWFSLENKSLYPAAPIAEPDQIKFAEWKTSPLAVDFLSMGNARLQGKEIVVEARLYDVKTQAQVVGRKYTISLDRIRSAAHSFADEIVYYLTAGASKGVASTQIAFVSKRTGTKEIFIMDYDGHDQRAFTSDKDINITPAWSHDNSKIAFTSWKTRFPEITIKTVLGGVRIPFPAFRSMASSPSFSPDGKNLVFAARSPESGFPNLYLSAVDGTRRVNLTSSSSVDTAPSWNPTGRQIAFVSDRTGTPELYIIDADGTNLRRLTAEGGSADEPDWSPDGRHIAFTWRPKQQPYFDIYLFDLGSTKMYQLTSNSRNNENPTWAPDGRHLAFQSNRDGTDQIFVMVSDGKGVRKLTSGGGSNEAPSWSRYPAKRD